MTNHLPRVKGRGLQRAVGLLGAVIVFAAAATSAQGVAAASPNLASARASNYLPSKAYPDPGSSPIKPSPAGVGSKTGSSPKTLTVGGTWSWQNPLPDGNPLLAISCPSASTCFAASSDGRVRATTNGGATWAVQTTGISTPINGISCADTLNCVAVGDFGEAIRTTNGGAAWSSVIVNGGNFLAGVSCPTASICFAVGALGAVLTSSDGGASWVAQSSGTTNDLFAISCTATTNCVAVGANGTITRTADGTSWTVAGTGGNSLFGVSCLGSAYCMAVGQGGTALTSTNPGCCWSPGDVGSTVTLAAVSCQNTACFSTGVDGSVYVRLPLQGGTVPGHGSTGANGGLYGISCPTAMSCFAVGDFGTVVVTTNGGTAWTSQTGLGTAEFGVSCPSATVCVAVGFGGAIASTSNGGTTWSGQTSATTQNLFSVSCPSTTACFAVGFGGTVIATTNGGTSWSPQTSNTLQALHAISCVTTTTCFAVTNDSSGAKFIKTIDGATWSTPAAVGAATGLTGISCPTTTSCFATDEEPTTNLIYSTTNGGATWSLSFNLANDPNAGINAPFAAIACPSTTNCYAVGSEGLIAATSDGGLNWRTDNSPTAAQLSAISCPSAGSCYASVYEFNGSTILHTTDYGGTWTAQYGGGTGQFAYTSISCPSTTTCVAIGYGGTAAATTTGGAAWSTQLPAGSTNAILGMSCTSASDCYAAAGNTILVTHNGGNTWAANTLGTTDQLVAISCPAANTCFAVGWPGAIYFTSNGGTTWTYQPSYLSGSDQTLIGVSCSSAISCVAVGTQGTIISTSNGTTWAAETSGTTQLIRGVSCTDSYSCIAVGVQGLTMTRSGGSWQAYPSGTTQNLHGVSCPSSSKCYAVGNAGTVLVTSNRGANWSAQASGTAVDLYGVSCPQTTLCLAGGNFGATVVSLDGSSWSVLNVPTGNALRAVVFEDINHAWVAGAGGTILANPNLTPACATVSVSASPSSPQLAGTPVLLTAVATGCPSPRYRFWIRPAGGSWAIVQDYSAVATYNWNTAGAPGTYNIEVDARDASETNSYDVVANATFTTTSAPSCANAGLSANPASPRPPGTQVIWTASSTVCTNPRYQFWEAPPGRSWSIVQAYSAMATLTWNSPNVAGSYRFEVDVRDASETTSYDTVANSTYVLGVTPCTTPGLTASPPSPGATGAGATFTATTTGCPNARYQFWVQPPGGAWSIAQPYGMTSTFAWSGGGAAGVYHVEVDVRDASESISYDAVTNTTYQLNPCSAVTLSAAPTSPQAPGTSVVLTGTATCPGTASYRFWVRTPAGAWSIMRVYSTTNTFTWNTTGLAAGSYGLEVDVRNQGASASYEAVGNITYVLGVNPCTTPTLVASPVSPGPTGGSITFTATTTGCPTPNYRFWLKSPGSNWNIVQPYSGNNTFLWQQPATGLAGSYGIEVDVRDSSETTSYDAVMNIVYTLKGCTAAGLTASPTNTAPHGSTVALTATATCPAPQVFYRFWIKAPGGSWTIVQDYSSSNTFTWTASSSPINTTVPGTYSVEVDVRDQGSLETYESVANITYSVS
jgi:photosystem II stability/assembly factor-like uncharacterized protein